MNTLKLISWNVNGIRAVMKKGLSDIVKELDPDIFCLQETKAQDNDVEKIAGQLEGYHLYVNSAEKKGYSGTAIFSKNKSKSSTLGIGIKEHDDEGRIITTDFGDFQLINAYVPNSGSELKRLDYRKQWDEALCSYIVQLKKNKPVIFTGDLNVAHQPIDLARPKANYNKSAGYTQVEIDGIQRFLDNGLIDSFRHLHPDEIKYSFWSMRFGARAKNVGWRIDYFLVDERLTNNIKSAFILNDIMGSDHCPIGIELQV